MWPRGPESDIYDLGDLITSGHIQYGLGTHSVAQPIFSGGPGPFCLPFYDNNEHGPYRGHILGPPYYLTQLHVSS